jgi:hypothetical protein
VLAASNIRAMDAISVSETSVYFYQNAQETVIWIFAAIRK